MRCSAPFIILCSMLSVAQGVQPLVAIHDSELTRVLETMPASGGTPTGTGTTGKQWWPVQWHYYYMPESLQEALRSDGTAFKVVTDADILAGDLLESDGTPRYPILISLAAEATDDDEAGALTNYVAAGGFLLVGSSAFTRRTNGVSRGDFAFANEMGIHTAYPALTNWVNNFNLTKVVDHWLVSHIPGGLLTWQMPSAADEVSWPYAGMFQPERVWRVQVGDATVLANGDLGPYLLVKSYGEGCFIYDAAMQPLVGHGGYAPSTYAYLFFRKAIEQAFQSFRVPVAKLSPWPYQYDAAFMVRHDLENFQDDIASIAASAQFEHTNGVKGDYYFCTGTLRVEMTNSPAAIAGLRQAVTNFGATIAPHNGGLVNPQNGDLPVSAYDYWHWGPDQAFNVPSNSLPLPGFASGYDYAFTSLSNSIADLEGWLDGITNDYRCWVAPYFNATREGSFQMQDQLGVRVTGDVKLTPFPHWTLSKQTSGKRYPLLQVPVSDWYVLSQYQETQVSQSVETGHTPGSLREAIDFYYNLGALVDIYNHHAAVGGNTVQDYIRYGVNTNLHPRLWGTGALEIYGWWLQRSNAQVTTTFATNESLSVATLSVSGATDPQTAVEIIVPGASVSGLLVLTNGVEASGNGYRTNGRVVRVQVGTTVTNAQISYLLNPTASNDVYFAATGQSLVVPAPGPLLNDSVGAGSNLTAQLLSGPAHGILSLTNDGGFSYTPTNGFAGVDSFCYQADDGLSSSLPAQVTIGVPPAGSLFFDDFTRPTNAANVPPWSVALGRWGITNAAMQGTAYGPSDHAEIYAGTNWDDYSVEAKVRLPAGAWEAGIGGRVRTLTGERYLAVVYPEGSPPGSTMLRLIKMHGWRNWSFTPMAQVALPGVGTNWHTLKMTFNGNRIQVNYDGAPFVDVTDTNFDGGPAYANGAVSLHLFMSTPFVAAFDDVNVTPLPSDPPTLSVQTAGAMIQLAWPIETRGWRLQTQTGDLDSGLGTNWTDVTDSTLTNQMFIPMNPTGATFFRLAAP